MCASTFAHVLNFYSHITVHIFDVTEQICLSHLKYEPHRHYATWTYGSIMFVYMFHNISNYNIYFTCYCHVCASNKYVSNACRLHTPNITVNISKTTTECIFNLTCYCYICAHNKYAPIMPYIGYMPKLLILHQWGSWPIYMQHVISLASNMS